LVKIKKFFSANEREWTQIKSKALIWCYAPQAHEPNKFAYIRVHLRKKAFIF